MGDSKAAQLIARGTAVAKVGAFVGVSALCSFLSVPLLAHWAPSQTIGVWALIESVLVLAPGFVALGLHHYLVRLGTTAFSPDGTTVRAISSAALVVGFGGSLLVSGAFGWLGLGVAALVFGNLFCDIAVLIQTFRARGSADVRRFGMLTAARPAAWVVLLIITTPLCAPSIEAILASRLLAGGIVVIAAFRPAEQLPVIWSPKRAMVAAKYGFPIALAGGAVVACDFVERLVLFGTASDEVEGYYLAAKYAAILGVLLITPATLIFPLVRRKLAMASSGSALVAFQLWVLVPGMVLCVVLVSSSGYLLPLFGADDPTPRAVVILLMGSALIRGMATIFSPALYTKSGGRQIMFAALTALAVDVVLCIVLVRVDPLKGVAIASLLGATVYSTMIASRSYRLKKNGLHPYFLIGCATIALVPALCI